MLNNIKKVWKGEEKLWKVFWLWGLLGNILMILFPHIINFLIPLHEGEYWLVAFIEMTIYAPLTIFLIFWNGSNTKYLILGLIVKYLSFILFLCIIGFFLKTKIFSYLF